jgi:predicted kinase
MDLWRRRLSRHANLLWNGYVFETADFEGTCLLPLFLSCRAAVRAKTSATALALQEDPQRRRELQLVAGEYLAMARDLLDPPQPCLVAVGGFSGSGKSTLAQALAPHLGAVPGATVIRSDAIRKQLFGVEPLVALGSEAYTSDVSRRVYDTAGDRAGITVRGGHAAVVDAVFGSAAERDAIERVAAAAGVPFVGLWLDAPGSVLTARTSSRRNDPSDADAAVVQKQLAEGAGAVDWHRIDAAMAPGETHRRAEELLSRFLTAPPR